jgi:hypothetical protein
VSAPGCSPTCATRRSDARTGAAPRNDRRDRRICASASDAPSYRWAPRPPPPPTVPGRAMTASTPASAAHAPHSPTRQTDPRATAPRPALYDNCGQSSSITWRCRPSAGDLCVQVSGIVVVGELEQRQAERHELARDRVAADLPSRRISSARSPNRTCPLPSNRLSTGPCRWVAFRSCLTLPWRRDRGSPIVVAGGPHRAGVEQPHSVIRRPHRFTALLHHVDVDRLRAAYWERRSSAPRM